MSGSSVSSAYSHVARPQLRDRRSSDHFREARNSASFPTASSSRHIVQAPERDWREDVSAKLQELIRLPFGWDGYRGLPLSFDTANFAIRMLESICPSGTPVPTLVPGSIGDIQIEWHTAIGDIELHVRRPNSVHAWRRTGATDVDGEEAELTIDFRAILPWTKALSEPVANANAAAA